MTLKNKNKERLENFKNHYKGEFTVIDAIDGQEWKNTPLFKNWPCLGQSNTHTGYKGLQMSVIKSLKQARNDNREWAAIFEDDAEPPPDISFEKVIKTHPDSKVIYMDRRNKNSGDGIIPQCCMNCVIYHNSTFDFFIKELHPDTSNHMKNYPGDCLNDWYIPWLLKKFNIKTSNYPLVKGNKFTSTVSVGN